MKPLSYIRVSVPLCETLMFPDGLDCRLLSLLQYFGLSHWGKFVGRYTLCASIIIPEIFFLSFLLLLSGGRGPSTSPSDYYTMGAVRAAFYFIGSSRPRVFLPTDRVLKTGNPFGIDTGPNSNYKSGGGMCFYQSPRSARLSSFFSTTARLVFTVLFFLFLLSQQREDQKVLFLMLLDAYLFSPPREPKIVGGSIRF